MRHHRDRLPSRRREGLGVGVIGSLQNENGRGVATPAASSSRESDYLAWAR